MVGLYLHIPFCASICSYCNFNRGLFDGPLKTRYVDALEKEIGSVGRSALGSGIGADTIFFGGGTPSLLDPNEIARLIDACRASYALTDDAEITLETNPETVDATRLAAFRAAGVNRVSFGVQSFDDAELRRLGRAHTARRAEDAVREARAAGFTNVSFDLMLWLPGQSLESWMRTVERAVALEPDHLSLYLLELYPNAPLKEAMARLAEASAQTSEAKAGAQASDDEAADMYLAGLERLDAAGFEQYEISNVARPGYSSRHNVKYWQSGDWRGFGCGAHSTVDSVRWKNVASTETYIEAIAAGRDVGIERARLTDEARRQEALFTGLRLSRGIDAGNFAARFGVDPWAWHGDALAPALEDGLLWREGPRFGLTRRGMLVANEILATFV